MCSLSDEKTDFNWMKNIIESECGILLDGNEEGDAFDILYSNYKSNKNENVDENIPSLSLIESDKGPIEINQDLHGFNIIETRMLLKRILNSLKKEGEYILRFTVGGGNHANPVLGKEVSKFFESQQMYDIKSIESKNSSIMQYVKSPFAISSAGISAPVCPRKRK